MEDGRPVVAFLAALPFVTGASGRPGRISLREHGVPERVTGNCGGQRRRANTFRKEHTGTSAQFNRYAAS